MRTLIQKTYNNLYFPALIAFIYFILFGIIVYFIDFFNKGQIENLLRFWIVWNFRINFFLIIIGVVICFKDIIETLKEFKNIKGIFLIVLLIFSVLMTCFAAPRIHRIYYDEDIYANIGQTIALSNQTGFCNYGTMEYDEYYPHWTSYNKEPSGYPFLISLVFSLFGTNELYVFLLNNFLYGVSVLTVFFISWTLFFNYFISFISALIYAAIPHNMIWSNTCAVEPSAACLTGICLLILLIFLKNNKNNVLFLFVVMLPFACQMRPESSMIVFISIAALFIFAPKEFIKRKSWTYAVLSMIFFIPHILHFFVVSGESWGAEGAKFSLNFFAKNFNDNGSYYLNNKQFPFIISLFFIIGVFLSKEYIKERIVIFLWFLLFWGIFLFFYAGSYRYGADVRFALVSFIPFSILAGKGISVIKDKLIDIQNINQNTVNLVISITLIYFTFIQFLPLIRQVGQEAWGARYDHFFAKQFIEKIPRYSIILTQNPTMFLLWGQSAIQTYAGTNNYDLILNLLNKYQGNVYFHYNYWCNTQNIANKKLCQNIKDKFNLEEIIKTSEQDNVYGLYKMSLK